MPSDVKCWYCGDDFRVEAWRSEGEVMPMCRLHSATTRAALALRKAGLNAAADSLDEAIGIETRPLFAKWTQPKKELTHA